MNSTNVADKNLDPTPSRVRCVEPEYLEVQDFLIEEARLLDENLMEEWLELLAADIRYTMPVRRTVERREGQGFLETFHFDDDLESLQMRVWRFTRMDSAYAENPPSRTRRYVTNIRVLRRAISDEFEVTSYELLLRNRWDLPTYDFVSVKRVDILRRNEDSFKLAKREIFVDQVSLGTSNLAILL